MKSKISAFLILFCCTFSFSQTAESLKTDTKKLYDSFDNIDIEGLTNMLCANGNKADYDKLDAVFQDDGQKFRFVFTNAKFNYSPVKVIDGKSYCSISFRNVIRITYFKPINVDETQQSLKAKFSAQSVAYEKARNSFMIIYTAKLIAIAETGSEAGGRTGEANAQWRFVFNDNTLPTEIFQGCLSDDNTRKELGLN
ncbi:MAG TPA: hypothetical protein VK623_10455 [Flavobacterium sp.]|nr:hypothetical protein [Flavobacterium sp.]